MKLHYVTGDCSLPAHIAVRRVEATRPRLQDAQRAEGLVK